MIIELVKGLALILSLALLNKFILRSFHESEHCKNVAEGVLFGALCIIGMSSPIEPVDGVIFDGRSVVLSLAGYFSGWIGVVISTTMASVYRVSIGGDGLFVGIATIISCGGIGLLFRLYLIRRNEVPNLSNLLILGIITHLNVVGWFTLLPGPIASQVMSEVALPLFLTFTPAVPMLGWLLQDNLKRLETEKALRKVNYRLQQKQKLIDEHSIYSEADRSGKITKVNHKFSEVSGYSFSELRGKSHSVLGSGYHESSFFAEMWKTIAAGKVWSGNIKNRRKDGTYYWVKSTIAPIWRDSGELEGYASIRTDISTEIEQQEKLKELVREATEASEVKSNFIASMSHELRTPLNAINGFSEMMVQQVYGSLGNEKYHEYAKDINDSGKSLLEMIDSLLSLSRIDSQNYRINPEDTDLRALTRKTIQALSHQLHPSEVTISTSLPHDVTDDVFIDQFLVTHVLNNLLSNAVKAVAIGGRIEVDWHLDKREKLVLTVSDNGNGMPKEILEKLGQPFLHDEDAYKARHKAKGHGLGLHICINLLESISGNLFFESSEGNGTKAIAVFPLQAFQEKSSEKRNNMAPAVHL